MLKIIQPVLDRYGRKSICQQTAFLPEICKTHLCNGSFHFTKLFRSDKTALIYWAASDCTPMSKRDVYVKQLEKYVPVDRYGSCGYLKDCLGMKDRDPCLRKLAQKYKFYLAFENSICEEYITEKFQRTLNFPTVPIVMGAGPYERYAPRSSYINVFDFESPKHLANYLLYLDKNNVSKF